MNRVIAVVGSVLVLGGMSLGLSQPEMPGEPPATQDSVIVQPHPYIANDSGWVDSVMGALTTDERIGQLFMVAAYSNKDKNHVAEITRLVEKHHIGGLIFFQGGPLRQAKLTNHYQSKAKVPLLLSMDAEWGLGMRLDSVISYPRQMTLGAIRDNDLIYRMGADIAAQLKRLGVHVNLAPVVDVNNNPKNPVINNRSFGEDKVNVARKGIAYMKGLQNNGVMANAKHFPGHGDTGSDSHKTLPVIKHTEKRLQSLELYPFREMIREGLGSMMIAHLYIPALDSTENQASTLSQPIVTGLLKEDLGFKGLVFTDALNMKGVSKFYKPGEVDLKALLAGNDVLLFPEDVPTAVSKIKEAIKKGQISQAEVDARVRKILVAKQWAGLDNFQPVELENLHRDLNDPKYQVLIRDLIKASMTVAKNEGNLLPVKELAGKKIASLAIGGPGNNQFQKTLSQYTAVTHFTTSKAPTADERASLLKKLEGFDIVLVAMHCRSSWPRKNFGVTDGAVALVNALSKRDNVALTVFGSPYALALFKDAQEAPAVVVAYENKQLQHTYAAQMIFGANKATGHLPVSANANFYLGMGQETAWLQRFQYTIPEEVGLDSNDFQGIEKIVHKGIKAKAYPGCQVLVAKEGKVVYQRSFGHHTYKKKRPVRNSDIYDLASITKVSGTLPAVMKLVDEGKVDLDYSLCDYLPEFVDTAENYENMRLRDMLAHQAGLVPWIPFFYQTLVRGVPRFDVYSLAQNETYPYRVAENMYIHKNYPDSMMTRILNTRLRKTKDYKYSDVGYYFFQKIVEQQTDQDMEVYLANNFYRPMGLTTMGYLPRERFDLDQIVPTELDMLFRKQLVHGDVHDPGAAMQGGVGGHAGLFSNANDLAKLFQMYLNGGTYGGERYLTDATLKDFIRCQYCEDDNRRGAGFDKPVHGEGGPTCHCVSYESFGHSGFTGTIVWADPEEDLIYIFLSNRVYPDATNKKLLSMNIRTDIQQVIYDAVSNAREREDVFAKELSIEQ